MAPVPRYRPENALNSPSAFFSAGFRPFFFLAAFWSAVALPLSIAYLEAAIELPTRLSAHLWHAHEMIFGFGGAVVAGFLLTAIPNWTGRMPLQGMPLAALVLLWVAGRIGIAFSSLAPATIVAALDLVFPGVFLVVVLREIVAGRNWRNLPMMGALMLLFASNLLMHLDAMNLMLTAAVGERLGVATLVMLVALIGGRITPSFTRNWLVKTFPGAEPPATFDGLDRFALAATLLALFVWVVCPETNLTAVLQLVAGAALLARLLRWRGFRTTGEPLLLILHIGYGWVGVGLLAMGANQFLAAMDPTAVLHALTAGAIGAMTLAVMTRATRGHTGRPLTADRGTMAIYAAVTLAAILRISAPLTGDNYFLMLAIAASLWSAAYGLFVLLYFRMLTGPRHANKPELAG